MIVVRSMVVVAALGVLVAGCGGDDPVPEAAAEVPIASQAEAGGAPPAEATSEPDPGSGGHGSEQAYVDDVRQLLDDVDELNSLFLDAIVTQRDAGPASLETFHEVTAAYVDITEMRIESLEASDPPERFSELHAHILSGLEWYVVAGVRADECKFDGSDPSICGPASVGLSRGDAQFEEVRNLLVLLRG